MKFIFCFVFLCSLFVGCTGDHFKAEENFQHVLLKLHNEKRTNQGLEPLILNKDLCDYAQKHANNMALKNSLYHSSMNDVRKTNSSKSWNWVGENVAWGQISEQSVVDSWMWSPGHRWNILGKKFTNVGFGLAKDSKGRNYWCTVFAG